MNLGPLNHRPFRLHTLSTAFFHLSRRNFGHDDQSKIKKEFLLLYQFRFQHLRRSLYYVKTTSITCATTNAIKLRFHPSSQIPVDLEQTQFKLSLLDLGITHLLSLSPVHIPSAAVSLVDQYRGFIPGACFFIRRRVLLVYSSTESPACAAPCTYTLVSVFCCCRSNY